MQKTPLSLTKPAHTELPVTAFLSTADLASFAGGWLLDGEICQLSPQTLLFRRLLLDKLPLVPAREVRRFLRQGRAATVSRLRFQRS